jgi:hypothetical protein
MNFRMVKFSRRGPVYNLAKQITAERSNQLHTDPPELARTQLQVTTFDGNWDAFTLAAWEWLFGMREKVLFRVSVLGITIFSRTFGDLFDVWDMVFGDSPFDWKEGPGG